MDTRLQQKRVPAWRIWLNKLIPRPFLVALDLFVLRRRHDELLRIVNGVIGQRASAQEARTPSNPTQDTFHDGWQACAGLLRLRLKQNGYDLAQNDQRDGRL